jgi:acetyl-CoA hydrolase
MVDLRSVIRPGDGIVWGQACAEPQTLVEALVSQRAGLGGVACFFGSSYSGIVKPGHADHLALSSYCGIGANRSLVDAGALDVLPVPYSQLGPLIRENKIRCDVLLVQVSPPNARGEYSLGLAADYLVPALDTCRAIVAEVNDQVPWTHTERLLTKEDFDLVVESSRPPAAPAPRAPNELDLAIARNALPFVPAGAVLEFGIGALPDAICSLLGRHEGLRVHSGTVGDGVIELMRRGVVSRVDCAMLIGSPALFAFARDNERVRLRSSEYTHDARVLARQERFVAVNSAVEIDLTGQVNGELADASYLGAVGGALDFVRAANSSHGGVSIVVLPAERFVHACRARYPCRAARRASSSPSAARRFARLLVKRTSAPPTSNCNPVVDPAIECPGSQRGIDGRTFAAAGQGSGAGAFPRRDQGRVAFRSGRDSARHGLRHVRVRRARQRLLRRWAPGRAADRGRGRNRVRRPGRQVGERLRAARDHDLLHRHPALRPGAFGVAAAQVRRARLILAVLFSIILLGGAFQALFGLTRLGTVIRFIPQPVMSGFQNAAALLLLLVQLGNLFGFDKSTTFVQALKDIQHARPLSLLLAVLTIVAMLQARRWLPKVPALLVALATGTVVYYLLGLAGLGSYLGPTIGIAPFSAYKLPNIPHFADSARAPGCWRWCRRSWAVRWRSRSSPRSTPCCAASCSRGPASRRSTATGCWCALAPRTR